jgi:glutathione S-transferase
MNRGFLTSPSIHSSTFRAKDSGKPYERALYTGGPIHPSVVAVPAVKLDDVYLSQTMAIMEALGDAYNCSVPSKAYNKALQCMLNIYDINGQALEQRVQKIKTKIEAAAYVSSRMKQFFAAIEEGYKCFPGPLFCSDAPSFVDYMV